MTKRVLHVQLKSRPTADGRERLTKAVSWMVEHAKKRAAPSRTSAHENEPMDDVAHEEIRR
jgi:hypothetical protein